MLALLCMSAILGQYHISVGATRSVRRQRWQSHIMGQHMYFFLAETLIGSRADAFRMLSPSDLSGIPWKRPFSPPSFCIPLPLNSTL